MKEKRPVSLTILAIVQLICAQLILIVLTVTGLFILFGPEHYFTETNTLNNVIFNSTVSAILLVLFIVSGVGLLTYKKGARILTMIISIIEVVWNLIDLYRFGFYLRFYVFIPIVTHSFIFWFINTKKIKEWFNSL